MEHMFKEIDNNLLSTNKQTRLYIQSDAMDGQFPIIPKPEFRAFWGDGTLAITTIWGYSQPAVWSR